MDFRPRLCSVFLMLALALGTDPVRAAGWFDENWMSRKHLIVDAGLTGADLRESVRDFPMLVRLHAGNFGFFQELGVNAADLRFLGLDGTPLTHHTEYFDPGSEIALLWVKLPRIQQDSSTESFWMYYGNKDAADAGNPSGSYDPPQALVFHFKEDQILPQDVTANGNHALASKAIVEIQGWIGAAARFDGSGPIEIAAAPSLRVDRADGWTFSAWVRLDRPQRNTTLFRARQNDALIELTLNGNALSGRYRPQGSENPVPLPPADLPLDRWSHVALVVGSNRLALFIDGIEVRSTAAAVASMIPTIQLGGDGAGHEFSGALDEVQIARTARSPEWIKLAYRSQSPDFTVINFGSDERGEGTEAGYLRLILQNITTDGWVIIGLTGLLGLMSLTVAGFKLLLLIRVGRQNAQFLGEGEGRLEVAKSGGYPAASLARLERIAAGALDRYGPRLDAAALAGLRIRLDTEIRREVQRLSRQMVLLTLSISGGPFLGLLGTVVGVMITFASIAETGDININAIAPGVAAALAATCAGLAIAIPALFAYNYLITWIKEIVTDTEIYRDERLAELNEASAGRIETLP